MPGKITTKCGETNRNGNPCNNIAGMGTDHIGTGPCMHHTPAAIVGGVETGEITLDRVKNLLPLDAHRRMYRYTMAKSTRLGELMGEMGAELVIERDSNGRMVEIDFGFELTTARALLVNFIERHSDIEEALLKWATAYQVGDTGTMPPKLLPIEDASRIIATIAKLAETMQKLEQSVPRSKFIEILGDMGDVVDAHVDDVRVKQNIQQQWMQICATQLT